MRIIRLGLSAATVLVLLSTFSFAQFRTVTVQNANNNPVPTTVTNTPTVNVTGTVPVTVSGTPSVNATITGTPNVNATITGTPNVAVTSPVGTAGPSNTTGVLIKNLDNPARQPFLQGLTCTSPAAGAGFCTASFAVPAGKRLVIEYLQFNSVESASTTLVYQLIPIVTGFGQPWLFAPGPKLANGTLLAEHQVRLYADAGSSVSFTGYATSNAGNVTFSMLLSGYLVNVP